MDQETAISADMDSRKAIEQFSVSQLAILQDRGSSGSRAVLVAPSRDIPEALVTRIISLSGGGLFFVAMPPARCEAFFLGPMRRPQTSSLHFNAYSSKGAPDTGPAQCISVDAREGVTTGISAADRAITLRILGDDQPRPGKLVKPGHVFPVEASQPGLLLRHAIPEGALDLVRLSGKGEAALFVDLLDETGSFLSFERQQALAEKEGIPVLDLDLLTRYRLDTEKLVQRVAEAQLPTRYGGNMKSVIYRSEAHAGEHLALVKGTINSDQPVLTRVQAEFTFADVFGGPQPTSRAHIASCLKAIGEKGSGVFLYLRQTSRGELVRQLEESSSAYRNQPTTMMREYGLGAQILHDLGVRQIELLTNSQKNLVGLKSFGIEIVSQLPVPEGTL